MIDLLHYGSLSPARSGIPCRRIRKHELAYMLKLKVSFSSTVLVLASDVSFKNNPTELFEAFLINGPIRGYRVDGKP
jgi:hypothetical protein